MSRIYGGGGGILEFCISLTSRPGHHELHVYSFIYIYISIANQKVVLNQGATHFCLAWQGFLGARVCFFWWSRLSRPGVRICTYVICVSVLQNANAPKMPLKLWIGNYRSLPSSCIHGSILARGSKKHILICEFDQNMFFMCVYYTVYCHLNPAPLPLEQSRNTNSVLKRTALLGQNMWLSKLRRKLLILSCHYS